MNDERGGGVTRRGLLLAGAASLGSTAGCALRDSDATDGPAPGAPDAAFTYPLRSPHETTQFNPWSPGYPRDVSTLFYAYRSVYRHGDGRRFDHVIDAVEIDGETVTVRYSDQYRWWNGEPVTARDDYVHLRIQELIRDYTRDSPDRPSGSRPDDQYDFEVALVDEYTLEYEFQETLNPRLARGVVASGVVNTAAWLFSEWITRLEDASTAEERNTVLTALREWTIPFEEMVDRGFGCGPFEPTRLLEPRVECELFDQHPYADVIDVDRVHLPVARGTRARQMLVEGQLDAGQRTLTDLGPSVPSYIEQLDRYRLANGTKLLLNWRGPLADRRVRWAIAAAIPFGDLAANSGLGEPVTTQTGMGTPADDRWLLQETRHRLYDHPIEAAPELAARHLAAAGYAQVDDSWRDADDNPIELRLSTPMLDSWTAAARTIGESLRAIGIEVRHAPVEFNTFFSSVNDGVFDMALWWNAGTPFEVYDVTNRHFDHLGYGIDEPSRDRSALGKPVAPRVPTTVSGPEATDGDRYNLVSRWRTLRSTPTDARVREAVAPFARWWNYDLPDIQLVDDVAAIWGNTRAFVWPETGDPALRTYGPHTRPELYALQTGAVERRS